MPTPTDVLRSPVLSERSRRIVLNSLVLLTAVGIMLTAVSQLVSLPSPIDFELFGPVGMDILTGRWAAVFANPVVQAGPLELVYWGIPAALGLGAISWIGFYIAAGALAGVAMAFVTERVLRELTPNWSLPLALGVTALAAFSGVLVGSVANGHPAQLAIPLLWLAAGLLARKERPLIAAVLVGLTAGWEAWGLLGLPLLLLAPRVDFGLVWKSAVGVAAPVVLMFAPFALLGQFRMFGFSWKVDSVSLVHLLAPQATDFPWGLRIAQGAVAVGAGAVTAFLTRRSPDCLWVVPLAVCSFRLLLDPVLLTYYSIAPVVLLLVGLAFTVLRRSLVLVVGSIVVINVLDDLPRPNALSVGLLALFAVVAVAVTRRRVAERAATRRA